MQSGGGDGEPHQRPAEALVAVAGQDREPVALPQPAPARQRVEPDRAADVVVGEPDDVDGRRVGVVGIVVLGAACFPVPVSVPVSVPAGARGQEQPLLGDEHPVPDPEVLGKLGGRRHRPAGDDGLSARPGMVSGC